MLSRPSFIIPTFAVLVCGDEAGQLSHEEQGQELHLKDVEEAHQVGVQVPDA